MKDCSTPSALSVAEFYETIEIYLIYIYMLLEFWYTILLRFRPNKRQAIAWANDIPSPWCIYAPYGINELTRVNFSLAAMGIIDIIKKTTAHFQGRNQDLVTVGVSTHTHTHTLQLHPETRLNLEWNLTFLNSVEDAWGSRQPWTVFVSHGYIALCKRPPTLRNTDGMCFSRDSTMLCFIMGSYQ